jgi:Asp-tRNA(Asn)/Glu-tRNA(Gln) amidotransferase B subunit
MLAGLMTLVDQGITTARSARELPVLVREGGDPAALVRERGLDGVRRGRARRPSRR